MKKKMGPTFYSQYPGTTVDLVVRHQNGKTITVKPEPIGWTPPTEEEHKAVMESLDELKPFEPMKQSQFEILLYGRDQKNVNILIEYHEELLKYIEELISEKCDLQTDVEFEQERCKQIENMVEDRNRQIENLQRQRHVCE